MPDPVARYRLKDSDGKKITRMVVQFWDNGRLVGSSVQTKDPFDFPYPGDLVDASTGQMLVNEVSIKTSKTTLTTCEWLVVIKLKNQ